MAEDYYATLGVSKDASVEEIKKAFRKLALRFHPDKTPGDKSAEKKFKEVSEAFEVLSDPAKRKAYDERGAAGVKDMGFEGFQNTEEIFSHFGSLFGEFFGSGFRRPRPGPRRGGDLRFAMTVPFREAALGSSREIAMTAREVCPKCRGAGEEGGGGQPCPTCRGTGQTSQKSRRRGGFFSVTSECPACGGTGRVVGNRCGECGGAGLVVREKRISIRIPAGIADGAVLRLGGQGEAGPGGGPPGDLFIEVTVEADPGFQRDGLDIRSSAKVPLAAALLGGKVEVETLRGRAVLRIPAGTSSDSWLRLRGQGIVTPSASGDHLVRIVVTVPKDVPPEVEKAVRETMPAT